MCTIVTPNIGWPYYDAELEELKRQLRLAQIEEEKARIRRELARLRRLPYPCIPPNWVISHQPTFPVCPAPMPISIGDVLRKIPQN
jgi:hypothetical protein